MKESDENLTPEEKLNQENFVMKSKLILKGGILHDDPDIDPELENIFLKNVLAFENAEVKPLFEILGVDPKDYPPVDSLSESEIAAYLKELTGLFEKHQIYLDLREGVPDKVIYQFLTGKIRTQSDNFKNKNITNFNKAFSACMEGKVYTVK